MASCHRGAVAAIAYGLDADSHLTQPSPSPPAATVPSHRCPAHYLWAMLLARLFESLRLVCPSCGADMRIVAFITETATVRRSGGRAALVSACHISACQRLPRPPGDATLAPASAARAVALSIPIPLFPVPAARSTGRFSHQEQHNIAAALLPNQPVPDPHGTGLNDCPDGDHERRNNGSKSA